MYECAIHTDDKHDWFGEKKFRLATFFDQWWDIYCKEPDHFIQPEQYKAVNDIRSCRTATLGVEIYTCPECGDITEVYHNCKNRFCPTCSWNDTVLWAERVQAKMLKLAHRHVVFTTPHQLNGLIIRNKALLLTAIMQTSAQTLKEWMNHKYGLQPGIISVLHTAGEQKLPHFHTHMLLSWGGIDDNRILKPIKGDFVNYDFIKDKFSEIFEKKVISLFLDGKLDIDFRDVDELKRFFRRIRKKKWIVHFNESINTPADVIRYIGRYSKRACLSERKISRMDGEFIGFIWKDYKNLDIKDLPIQKELVLNYREFFPRLLQHVPLPGFRMVRYYGLYSNRGHLPKEYFTEIDDTPVNWREVQEEETGQDPLICPHCNVMKIYAYSIAESSKGSYKYFRLSLKSDQHMAPMENVA